MSKSTDSAAALGREFAEYLNGSADRDNWSPLQENDDLPEGDYIALRTKFGSVSREMERAYKAAFNAAFIAGRPSAA